MVVWPGDLLLLDQSDLSCCSTGKEGWEGERIGREGERERKGEGKGEGKGEEIADLLLGLIVIMVTSH